MSLWCDDKYLRLISGQLDQFKYLAPQKSRFRCPFCGDSARNKLKARGYTFPKQQTIIYKCHNCDLALPFGAFLKRLSRPLFNEYIIENFRTQAPTVVATPPPTISKRLPILFAGVDQLSSASLDTSLQSVRDYVSARQLPDSALTRLYGTLRGHTWLASLVGKKKARAINDGLPYLVIPLRLANHEWYGAQMRLLTRKEYLTFRWGHDQLRVFGLDACDRDALTYCVEGPLDALCAPNAIAMCGSDILSGLERLHESGATVDNRVLVWDNEPRNKQITKHLRRAITAGERVVIWPRALPKDLNDMVAAGHDVEALLSKHTYRGLSAELEYRQWTI